MLVQLLNLKYIYDSFSLRHHDVIMSDSFSTLFNVTSICWLSFITNKRVHDKNATYSCNWKFASQNSWMVVALKSCIPNRKNINTTWTNVTKHKISRTFWIPWRHLVLKLRSLGAARSNGNEVADKLYLVKLFWQCLPQGYHHPFRDRLYLTQLRMEYVEAIIFFF